MSGRDARDSDVGGQPRRGMFGKPLPEERRVAAWIGASLVIKGDLTSSEDMTLAGRVEGDVSVREHTLVIAPRARVQGNITARAVAVHGEVVGTIRADRVEVGSSGSVEGDITAPKLVIDEGAALNGRVGVSAPS